MFRSAQMSIARTLLRLSLVGTQEYWADLPRPQGPPLAAAPGPEPISVLLFGSGPAVGYGVLSHDLALPGHMARQFAHRVGRGIRIDVVVNSDITAASAFSRLNQVDLGAYDAVVITVGVNDALRLTPVDEWESSMSRVVELIAMTSGDLPVFLVEPPSMEALRRVGRLATRVGNRHAARLSIALERLSARYPTATFVPFSPERDEERDRHRSPDTYRKWAAQLVPPLAAAFSDD